MKTKTPLIMQVQQAECGLCCAAMVLNSYNHKKTIYELRNEFTIGRDGLSLSNLKKFLQKEKMDAKIYKASQEGIPYLTTPFIALWNHNHFVVVDRVYKNSFEVLDPGLGRKKLKKDEFFGSFSGYVLDAKPTDDFTEVESAHKNPWIQLLGNLKNKTALCIGIILFTFLAMLLQLMVPILTQRFIDSFTLGGRENGILLFLIAALAISSGFLIINLFRGMLLNLLNVFLSRSMTKSVFSHMLDLSYEFFDVRSPGDLLYRLNSILAVRELISNSIIPGIVTAGTALSIAIYLFYNSLTMGLLVVCLTVLNCFFLFATKNKVTDAVDNELLQQSKTQSVMTETLYSMIFVKMSSLEKLFFNQWESAFDKAVDSFYRRSTIQNVITSISSSFQMASPLIIMAYGFYLFIEGELTLGEVIAIQTISATLFSQVNSLFSSYTQLIMADSYLKRILDITLAKTEIREDEGLSQIDSIESIEFRDVAFRYSDYSEPSLMKASFTIQKGEKIGVVGKSGSGKSTLAKLLTGLYTNTSGEILINGRTDMKINNRSIQQKIGIVPQDILLFNKSILQNITMGLDDFTVKDVEKAARMANIHDEILNMPMGYETVVSDMGLNISGGQRQRIMLARALVRNPEFLILDEATSSLDNHNERIISAYLKEMKCTTVVVAHRLQTIIDADQIIVMNQGQIAGMGTHDELIAENRVYQELYYAKG
ncbi:peptidase domain-containing ABC transporter [Planococcus maitriensis]|uniref:Peptidase domain-containing ABC transporter n=1 Tax=Planococcus maitriensis TaxID=221799 RepID=A0A365K3T0_9BACL|nr:peptidase domain-containing ABC transporter [Planococcus maitriensis]RAZ67290.1 peptidase domain-containing ABC transporter [Planococcus maitriensis]